MNLGLSKVLKEAFPHIIPVKRPNKSEENIPDPNWISGFSGAEGCFDIKKVNLKSRLQVQPRFRISQHERDRALLGIIMGYLKCGTLQISRNTVELTVVKYDDILNIIIPFFDKYPIFGEKQLDFKDFKSVVYLLKEKNLTDENLEKILEIKVGMNTGRTK